VKNLQGAVAIITGAGSGIGRGTAQALAARGAKVIVADRDRAGAEETVGLIAAAGGTATPVENDVLAPTAFTDLREAALSAFGRVDIVMNNVGALTRGRPDAIPVDEWRRVLEVNLLSVVRSNDVFVPLFLEQGSGHIVNTASFAGLYTYAWDRTPYAAAKAAVVQLSEGLRLYLHPQGIGVTVLCPGPVMTGIMRSLPPTFGPETPTRGPGKQFELLQPDAVGELVAQAIIDDTFWLPTHPQVREVLVERASGWDAFLAHQEAEIQAAQAEGR
jgi:NAD(P)-dependent dehydrogenase (short-subunit alcohol dehydrogenase family)